MTGPGHDVAAVTAALAATQAANATPNQAVIVVGCALIAARWPDLDLRVGLPHRTITHWLATNLLAAAATYSILLTAAPAYATPIAAGVAIGLLSHILADACTPDGVPLLAPFDRRPKRLLPWHLRITTSPKPPGAFYRAIPQTLVVTILLAADVAILAATNA